MLKEHKGKLFDQHGTSTIFHTPSQSDFLHHDPAPLCTNDPFVDKYANPALIRGIPRSQEEYKRSLYDRKAYFITTPGKPFYTATEGNKSTVLHNDLFDVIAEAEYSGGVGQRHLSAQMGVTSRYGLAECVDRRLVSPARVVHTSTTQSSLINKSICTNTAKKNTNKIIHKDYNLLSSILSSSSGKSQVRARVWNDDSDSDDEE